MLNWFFAFHLGWGIRGLALGTGCVAMANFLILYFLMRRETTALGARDFLFTLGKLAVPSAALAAVCWAAQAWLLGAWLHWGIVLKLAALLTTIGVAAAAYFLAAMALRIPEFDDVTGLLKRKLGRRFAR